MPFTIDDFQDLLRLLEQRPEWRAELRRQVLTDELLELPAIVRDLAEAQKRTEAHLDALTQRVDALTERVDALAVRVDALAQRVDALAEHVDALTQRVDALAVRVDAVAAQMAILADRLGGIGDRVGAVEGELLEWRYERRAAAYFSRLARRLRVVDRSVLANMLDDAIDSGRLSQEERDAIMEADLVLSGQRRQDGAEAYFVVEVSVGVGLNDVQRAAERAGLLAKLDRQTVPVVAGNWVNDLAQAAAQGMGVWQVLDGHTVAPSQA